MVARVAGRSQHGFTLLEVMITCAIIAILSAIVIPSFMSDTLRGKAKIEVNAFFAELSVRQEQNRVDSGAYLSTAQCPSTAPTGSLVNITSCVAVAGVWNPLRVSLPQLEAYCAYTMVAGTGTGTNNPGGFVFTSPAGQWYYLTATCDMDNDGTFSQYFTSSVDSSIQIQNEGE